LLAEDNEVNVYIFRAMLDGLPLALQHAPNGPTALAMLRQQVFDIAFIDVQMPGMDGLTVTRELRALEAARGRARAPVVALTANAFASDIQSSLDAGCDRHIAKPFSRELLVQAIEQLVLNGPAQPGPAAPPTAVPDDNAASGITVLDAAVRRLNGDATLYGRLAEHALVFLAEWAQHFDQALAEPDLSHAHRLAHDLKSIAATVGAQALSDHAARLEQSLWNAGPESRADASALAQTLAALPPVIAALSTADARN
jgi:CheY-like chemotaxis protein/HPt (histidine-containing phosphotransfer) domain-containing protein